MTGTEKDPFERLSQIRAPEPDPRRLASAVATSSRAFAQNHARPARARTPLGRLSDWISGTGWAMPASAVAAALLVIVSIPLIGRFDMPGPARQASEPSREQAADSAPTAPPSLSRAPAERPPLGAAPAPQTPQASPESSANATVETYEFGGIGLVMRSTPEEAVLSLREGGVERPVDRRIKEPSETIVVSDAFVHEGGETRLLLIRSGFEGGAQQWDAFTERDGNYALSGAVSLAIHDAADRAEVMERLDDTTVQEP